MADEDVVDEFAAAAVDAADALVFGNVGGQVPQPLTVAAIADADAWPRGLTWTEPGVAAIPGTAGR